MYYNNKKIIVGISSKEDDSTLNRFFKLGHKTWRIDEKDLKISSGSALKLFSTICYRIELIISIQSTKKQIF